VYIYMMYEQEIFLILFLKKKKKRERSLGKGSNGQMISFRGQFDTSLPKVSKLVGQSRLVTGGTNSQRTFRSRFLSYKTGKLPALSGLTSTFAESFGPSPYLVGI
jgi:hypothetical protein